MPGSTQASWFSSGNSLAGGVVLATEDSLTAGTELAGDTSFARGSCSVVCVLCSTTVGTATAGSELAGGNSSCAIELPLQHITVSPMANSTPRNGAAFLDRNERTDMNDALAGRNMRISHCCVYVVTRPIQS